MKCPICKNTSDKKYRDTPYYVCGTCDLWYQDAKNLPKVMHGDHELPPDEMSDGDKLVNEQLARNLFFNLLNKKPTPTLDIGCAYPQLASSLTLLGCDAHGMEPGESVRNWCTQLAVNHLDYDFESFKLSKNDYNYFGLITMIHVFEHMYSPTKALKKLRKLIKDDGYVFIRIPDHSVSGFERDLTIGHYTIHPNFFSYDSFMHLMYITKLFYVKETYPLHGAGQRDFILSPI